MRRTIPIRLAEVTLAMLVAGGSAQGAGTRASGARHPNAAASFDCARASSAVERTICGDPALSTLDGRLGRLYRERRALLSPNGAKLLQDSQRSWVRFVRMVCSPDDPGGQPWRNRKTCLTREYTGRLEQLQKAAQKTGPYLFNRIDLYAAQPSGDDTGATTGFNVQHAAYPQIDNATSPEARAWNLDNVYTLPTHGDCGQGDYDIDYQVGYANAQFVSVQWTNWTYCHGTPHGFGGVGVKNTVLAPLPRPLTPDDLFGPGHDWVAPLKARFWAALLQMGWTPLQNRPDVKEQLEGDFVRPDRWFVTEDGLQVAFGSYEGGCYACTPQPVTLPWSELKPLLSKDAVAP